MKTREIREHVTFFVAVGAAIYAVAMMFGRLRHGIDFTDEAFYITLPHRFVLGDQPFVDELNIAQTAGLFLYPFVKVYCAIRGTTGIFLFIRFLYIAFFVGVGWAAAGMARTRLPLHAAILVGTPCLTFLPYAIPGLSYNTLGAGLLAIGLFVLARGHLTLGAERPKLHRDPFIWGGFTLGAAAFAYPSLVLGAVLATATTFLLATGRRLDATLRVAGGGVLFGVVVAPLFLAAGPAHVKEVLAYSGGGSMGITWLKVHASWTTFLGQHPELFMLVLFTAAAIGVSRKLPRLVALLLPALPLLAKGATVAAIATQLGYFSSLALIAPLLAFAIKDSKAATVAGIGVWLPSALSGLAMALTSSNGVIAAGIALLPAAIASVFLLSVWISELLRTWPNDWVKDAYGFAPVVVLSTLLGLTLANDAVYRDGNVSTLTALIVDGPYKGLYTTTERRRSLAAMSRDILAIGKSQRMLFYYDFPVGYLIAQSRPLVTSPWTFAMEPRMTKDAEFFQHRASPGDLVVRVGPMTPSDNSLDRAVLARSEKLEERRDGYTAWFVR
jgi:hypothetical protein